MGESVLHRIGADPAHPAGDIVFVHGLGGSHPATWTNDRGNCWPEWLAASNLAWRVWSLAYDAEPRSWLGNPLPLYDRATEVIPLLRQKDIGERPFALVGHSMGGLLIKQLLMSAHTLGNADWQRIAAKCHGVAFLATPSVGADMASYLKKLGELTSVAVHELVRNDAKLRELATWYRGNAVPGRTDTLVFWEKRKTLLKLGLAAQVVDAGSADPGIPGAVPIEVEADHKTICKPETRESRVAAEVERHLKLWLARDVGGIISENRMRSSNTITNDYPHLAALKNDISVLLEQSSDAPSFDLRISIAKSYDEILLSSFIKHSLTPHDVHSSNVRTILIHSAGGSGKTAFLRSVALAAIQNRHIVFYLDYKIQIDFMNISDEKIVEHTFDRCSISGSFNDFKRSLLAMEATFLIIDGINELPSDASEIALRRFEALAREHSNLRLLLADRMNPHPALRFSRATMDPLTDTEIDRLWPANIPTPRGSIERQLLALPFFLDLQLRLLAARDGQPGRLSLTRVGMFQRYFSEVAHLRDAADLSTLAAAAFHAYPTFSSRSIDQDWWTKTCTETIARRLAEAGITIPKIQYLPPDRIEFRHQLLHDYLVACHIAKLGSPYWNTLTFDAATFTANAVEPIAFAAEILGRESDHFLTYVYDWSYRHAMQCIADLKRFVDTTIISRDLVFVMFAMSAVKLHDPFEEASQAARRNLLEASKEDVRVFLDTQSENDVIELVRSFNPAEALFVEWRVMMLQPSDTIMAEQIATSIGSDNPIIGWTASNVLRRLTLSYDIQNSLRFVYSVLRHQSQHVVRWRICHTLGAFPTRENRDMLLGAARSDKSQWTKYGAVRSLMEIASRSDELREDTLHELFSLLETERSSLVLAGIRKACLVRNPPSDWYNRIRLIAERAVLMAQSARERDLWRDVLVEIEQR